MVRGAVSQHYTRMSLCSGMQSYLIYSIIIISRYVLKLTQGRVCNLLCQDFVIATSSVLYCIQQHLNKHDVEM